MPCWTAIVKGTTAPKAAGKIHTDFERGFIRAVEVVNYDDLVTNGSIAAAREKVIVVDLVNRVRKHPYVQGDRTTDDSPGTTPHPDQHCQASRSHFPPLSGKILRK